jgi:heptosyltransferase-1
VQLAAAAGATVVRYQFPIPQGRAEGELPNAPFVLTTPFAGWAGKQWPLELLDELGARLLREGFLLVANVAESRAAQLAPYSHLRAHISSIPGLIYALRKAAAVVAPDSGPMHLAAVLQKPGVALFGPTDPVSHGPFGGTLTVLRAPGFETTYKRHDVAHASMRALQVDDVFKALVAALSRSESAKT